MEILDEIFSKIEKEPSEVGYYKDCLDVCMHISCDNFELSHDANKRMRQMLTSNFKIIVNFEKAYQVYNDSLLFDAPYYFDEYLQYLEMNRAPKDRFYQPRRKTLKQVVDALQDLVDDRLDELFISMPPRIGKTSIVMFFVTWIIGKFSEKSNLYSAFSDIITKAFYSGVVEILNDPDTYLWHDVFPNAKIVGTNAQDETLNIDRKKRYPSLTCRSLYGTLNGACDCNGFLISDDLIGGIEEALNKDRLVSAWTKVDNNLIPRAKETAKMLWVGTRWSMVDPAGLRMDLLENDERFKGRRYRIINLPALDKNDESQFDYDYGVGFSTEYYLQRRASFEKNNDMASWLAQYMGEPVEREGTLFNPEDFRYYNGELPDDEPDRIYMPVDPAFGGGDFVSSPVIFQYGEDLYVHDVVYSNAEKNITQPLIASKVIEYQVKTMRVEASKSTESYKEGIETILKEKGYKLSITSKSAPNNISKNQRIYDKAPDIREHMLFREAGKRTKEYTQFMQNVFSFKMLGKNKHDDAPDSLSMAIEMFRYGNPKVEVFKRPF